MVQQLHGLKTTDHEAKAVGRGLPISVKHAIEVCNVIRGLNVQKAKEKLQRTIDMKEAIPYTRFNKDLGHKRGKIGAGRYPLKTCIEIKKIVESAEANAQFKGLSASTLYIKHISPQKGPDSWHYGRQRRRLMKRCHIELIVEEKESKKVKPKEKKTKKEEGKK